MISEINVLFESVIKKKKNRSLNLDVKFCIIRNNLKSVLIKFKIFHAKSWNVFAAKKVSCFSVMDMVLTMYWSGISFGEGIW